MPQKITAAVTAPLLALLTACANQAPQEADADPDTIDILVTLTTDDNSIGQAPDGDTLQCVWRDPSYTIRDGADEIVSTGDATSTLEGDATAADHRAELGRQRTNDPYLCTLPFLVEGVPAADFYTIEVTTVALDIRGILDGDRSGQEVTAEMTVERSDAESTTPVEIDL